MMLWDIIRDFFVKYIFGGSTSNGFGYGGCLGLGHLYINDNLDDSWNMFGDELVYKVGSYPSPDGAGVVYLSVNDWLSTTATIITLIALLVAITMFIVSLTKWIIRLVSLRG